MSADNLLLWMSANGAGSWDRYCAAVEEIWFSSPAANDDSAARLPLHQRLRMNFERMAHAEFFTQGGTGWRIVPPALVSVCSGENAESAKAILCGARTQQLIAAIENAAGSMPIERTAIAEAPERIEITAHSPRDLEQLAAKTGLYLETDASRKLLAAIPHVDDRSTFVAAELPTGNDQTVHRFSCHDLAWAAVEPPVAHALHFGLFRYASFSGPVHFWKQGGKAFSVPGQVGKFIALKQAKKKVFRYGEGSQTATVPISCRPPMLIERALILATGRPPELNGGELLYSNIPSALAATARDLMRQ